MKVQVSDSEGKKKKNRFALLMAAKDSDYVKKMYGGYYNVFVEAFGEEGESWDLFRVVDGEFPETEDLDGYDGFVVSGSPHDAYGNEVWILKLRFLLQTLDALRKRVLGVCFGHQVICHALGGRVGKAYGGWEIGIRKVQFLKENLPPCNKFLQGLKDHIMPSSHASIIEIHQDEVWELPPGAEVIAFSQTTGVEMFMVEDHIMGIQGHPEYSKDILCNIIDRLVRDETIEIEAGDDLKAKLEGAEADREFWEKICKSFLKGRR